MSTHVPLPCSAEAESALIGSFFAAPSVVGALCAERGILPEFFYEPAHGLIYGVMLELWRDGFNLDEILVTEKLRSRGQLEEAGGPAGLMAHRMPTAANAEAYADAVIEKHLLRRLIGLGREFSGRAYTEQDAPMELLGECAGKLADLAGAAHKRPTRTLKQALKEKLERMQSNEPDADIIATGLAKLDRNSPLRLGDMVLIAGERKAGKSILSLTIAVNVALAGHAVLYFSLEDREPKVVDRLFAGVSRIPMARHHQSRMSEGDYQAAQRTLAKLSEAKFEIRDDVYDLAAMVAAARLAKTKRPELGLIVIDYAQLLRARLRKQDSREQEVAAVSRTLRLLSMELNVAVLLLVQLNKQGETRESKALEQDCTAMWELKKTGEEEEENRKRLLAIPFQRNGESGIVFPVSFLGHIARVENLAEEVGK